MNIRVNPKDFNRRKFLTAAVPAAMAATAVPALANINPVDERMQKIIAVIDDLEACQGWEVSCISAAKAFSAWQIRKAIGLDLPDPERAQMHVEYQASSFKSYKASYHYERDLKDGRFCEIRKFERGLT